MLSLQDCRKHLGHDCNLSDSELESLRDSLYGLADICLKHISQRKADIKPSAKLADSEITELEERSGIMEFDANLPRPIAERLAFQDLRKIKKEMPANDH